MSGIVELKIGDPIPITSLTLKDRAVLTETMHDKVANLLKASVSEAQETR
jgi:hypothetical protein